MAVLTATTVFCAYDALSYAEEAVQVNLGDYRFEKAYVTVYFN